MNLMRDALTMIHDGAAATIRHEPATVFPVTSEDRFVRNEDRAQAIFFPALAEFLSKVQDAEALTDLMKPDFQHLRDALSDHSPTREYWDEAIYNATHAGRP